MVHHHVHRQPPPRDLHAGLVAKQDARLGGQQFGQVGLGRAGGVPRGLVEVRGLDDAVPVGGRDGRDAGGRRDTVGAQHGVELVGPFAGRLAAAIDAVQRRLEPPEPPEAELLGRAAKGFGPGEVPGAGGHVLAEPRVDADVRAGVPASSRSGCAFVASAGSGTRGSKGAASAVGEVRRLSYGCTREVGAPGDRARRGRAPTRRGPGWPPAAAGRDQPSRSTRSCTATSGRPLSSRVHGWNTGSLPVNEMDVRNTPIVVPTYTVSGWPGSTATAMAAAVVLARRPVRNQRSVPSNHQSWSESSAARSPGEREVERAVRAPRRVVDRDVVAGVRRGRRRSSWPGGTPARAIPA